jgi:tight adherence protein C
MLPSLLDTLASDPALMLTAFGLCAVGALMMAVVGLWQVRRDVQRRAQTSGAELRNQPAPIQRHRQQNSGGFQTLMRSLDTLVAGQDQREMRLLRRQMIQAGFFQKEAIALFFGLRLLLCVVLGIAGFFLLKQVFPDLVPLRVAMWTFAAAGFGYFLPNMLLKRRIQGRIDQHRVGFPDFMDLMVVCSEAGLSMEAAIERIARELVDGYPSLAENLYIVSLEIRAGKTLVEALERLGERLGIEEAVMLATLLQQSSELGSSLSASLRVYSDEMRHKRLAKAEEKAYALPAKLTVPLTLFVFPVLIATLMVPVIIRFSASGF